MDRRLHSLRNSNTSATKGHRISSRINLDSLARAAHMASQVPQELFQAMVKVMVLHRLATGWDMVLRLAMDSHLNHPQVTSTRFNRCRLVHQGSR